MSTLSIRLPNSIHQHAKRLARAEGMSINQLVSSAVAEKLAAIDAERYLRERAERGQGVDIDAILAKIPHVKPEADDELPRSEASSEPPLREGTTAKQAPASAAPVPKRRAGRSRR